MAHALGYGVTNMNNDSTKYAFISILFAIISISFAIMSIIFSQNAEGSERNQLHHNITIDHSDNRTINRNTTHTENHVSDSKSASGSKATSNSQSGDVNVNTQYDHEEIPVSTAYAPPTIVTAPCAIGVSAGGQGLDIGLSFGTYYIDQECIINRDIALYRSLDMPNEFLHAVMCQKGTYRKAASYVAGMECPQDEELREIMSERECHIADEGCS